VGSGLAERGVVGSGLTERGAVGSGLTKRGADSEARGGPARTPTDVREVTSIKEAIAAALGG